MYFVYKQFLNCHAPFSRIQLLTVCNHNIWFSIFAENLVTRIIPWVWTDSQLQVDPSEHFHKIYFQGRSISLKIDFGRFGASKYLDELRLRTLSQTLDILASSETQLDNTFTDSPVSTQGYSLVRSDWGRSGSGVAIYVHYVIDWKIRSNLCDPDLEFLCIQIQKPQAKLVQTYEFTNWPLDKLKVLLGKIEVENIGSNILCDLNWHVGNFPS